MHLSQITFRSIAKIMGILAISALVLAIVAMIIGDGLILPWYDVPTYVKTPLFLEYFRIDGQPFGIMADQVLVWQHFTTGQYEQFVWTDYLLFTTFIISLVTISITLTYLSRPWYLFCTGLMLLFIMQLNLGELGFLPEYIDYISLIIFGVSTYYFQNIKPDTSLFVRSLSITLIYVAFVIVVGQLAPIISPVSAAVSFGLFTPLMILALVMLFVAGDTMQVLFSLATKNAPNGKNGLIHFISIGIIYLTLLILLLLDKTGQISFDLWFVSPYLVLIASLVCGYLSLDIKVAASESELPITVIKRWLYPSLAALTLVLIAYTELTSNDSLAESLHICILATQLGGAAVFYVYALINFTPQLLQNEKVANFFEGQNAPLLTARVLQLVFVAAVFFYLNNSPYYQARAARYTALGTLGESVDSDLLAAQYYKQASFYDYYNFKANYALARLAKKDGSISEVIDYYKNAAERDPESKAIIALANYYGDNDQLFAKLLSLKQAKAASKQMSNNLGIAHFEFNQYDSALMAIERSIALSSNAEAASNKLALLYHLPSLEIEPGALPAATRPRINAQAIANRKGSDTEYSTPLATDTVLYQDELFLLYNHGLKKGHPQAEELLTALAYYLSNRRNSPLKDFLLPAYAIQLHEAGRINEAFDSMGELLIIDQRNEGRHAFTLALWAAHLGARHLALEYLEISASRNYMPEEVSRLKTAIQNNQVPEITPELPEAGNNSIAQLKILATKNAFDEALTITAISALKKEGATTPELYELARRAIIINKYSLMLTETYAQLAIESGLSDFGKKALEALKGKADEQELDNALQAFEQKLVVWRNRSLD